eukprot:352544-Chlamydomonas_euryale.AAC.3
MHAWSHAAWWRSSWICIVKHATGTLLPLQVAAKREGISCCRTAKVLMAGQGTAALCPMPTCRLAGLGWHGVAQDRSEWHSKAKISLKKHKAKYAFIDHLNELRDREFNLTLAWDRMPNVGVNAIFSHTIPAGRLPEHVPLRITLNLFISTLYTLQRITSDWQRIGWRAAGVWVTR